MGAFLLFLTTLAFTSCDSPDRSFSNPSDPAFVQDQSKQTITPTKTPTTPGPQNPGIGIPETLPPRPTPTSWPTYASALYPSRATSTPTATRTAAPTLTPTLTPSSTPTRTPTFTATPSPTATPTPAPPSAFKINALPKFVVNSPPSISWTASAGADWYDVSVTTSDCTTPYARTTLAVTTWVPPVTTQGQYIVCVAAKRGPNLTTPAINNGTIEFYLDNVPPRPFSVQAPSGPRHYSRHLQFRLSDLTDAVTMTWILATDSGCSMRRATFSGAATATIEAGYPGEGRYYLCVSVTDDAGNTQRLTGEPFAIDLVAQGSKWQISGIAVPMASKWVNTSLDSFTMAFDTMLTTRSLTTGAVSYSAPIPKGRALPTASLDFVVLGSGTNIFSATSQSDVVINRLNRWGQATLGSWPTILGGIGGDAIYAGAELSDGRIAVGGTLSTMTSARAFASIAWLNANGGTSKKTLIGTATDCGSVYAITGDSGNNVYSLQLTSCLWGTYQWTLRKFGSDTNEITTGFPKTLTTPIYADPTVRLLSDNSLMVLFSSKTKSDVYRFAPNGTLLTSRNLSNNGVAVFANPIPVSAPKLAHFPLLVGGDLRFFTEPDLTDLDSWQGFDPTGVEKLGTDLLIFDGRFATVERLVLPGTP